MKTAVARSNTSGNKEFEEDDTSPTLIYLSSGTLQAGWFTDVGTLSRLRAYSLRASKSNDISSGSWQKASSKFAAVMKTSTSEKGSIAQM